MKTRSNFETKLETKDEAVVSRKKIKLPYGLIGKVILGSVGMAGMLSVALVAPNIFKAVYALNKQYRWLHRRYQSPAYARHAVNRLVDQKMILVFQKDGIPMIRLTDKGGRELLKYQLKEKSLKKPRWDKKWRIFIFDIEEKRRYARDRMRGDMQAFGFVRLQDSVWVYPYACEQIVTLLKAQYKIGKEMLYIVAEEVEDEGWLKKKFKLE